MDKSETYIKMCDHPLIWDGWEPKVGDLTDKGLIINTYTHPNKEKFYYLDTKVIQNREYQKTSKKALTWLLRQDDWQSVYFKTQPHLVPAQWFCFFHDEVCINNDYYDDRFTSAEQLWAAFTMHKLHNLKWTGEKWINEKREIIR